MRSLFVIPLILIIIGAAGYLVYTNPALVGQVKSLIPSSSNITLDQPKDTVIIQNFAFRPETVTVRVGDSVTWKNKDTASTHTATSYDGLWDSGKIGPGEAKSVTFSTPGTYKYQCSLHPGMTGTVIVK